MFSQSNFGIDHYPMFYKGVLLNKGGGGFLILAVVKLPVWEMVPPVFYLSFLNVFFLRNYGSLALSDGLVFKQGGCRAMANPLHLQGLF